MYKKEQKITVVYVRDKDLFICCKQTSKSFLLYVRYHW